MGPIGLGTLLAYAAHDDIRSVQFTLYFQLCVQRRSVVLLAHQNWEILILYSSWAFVVNMLTLANYIRTAEHTQWGPKGNASAQ